VNKGPVAIATGPLLHPRDDYDNVQRSWRPFAVRLDGPQHGGIMRNLTILAALSLAAMTAASSAAAQAHTGFYISAGGGYASNKADFNSEAETPNQSGDGVSYYANLGWKLSSKLAIGVEWNYAKTGCGICSGGEKITSTFYTAALAWFPGGNSLFVKVNLGYGGNSIDGDFQGVSQNASAAGIGVGFDWGVGKGGFIVKPFANYFTQLSKGTYGGALSGENVQSSASIFQIGLGIGFKH
jgi:hypothetical protein